MPKLKLSNPYIIFIALILVTRLIYTGIGILSREFLVDKSKPFPAWTYDSSYQALNVWTIWDSGYYGWIATDGYPDNINDKNAIKINIPQSTYIKIFLPGGVLPDEFTLPGGRTDIKITNEVFLIGSQDQDIEIELKRITAGLPYCLYKGPIDYNRDVLPFRSALSDKIACGGSTCDEAVITYYDADMKKTVFQETYNKNNYSTPKTNLGDSRPVGFSFDNHEGLGCNSIKIGDLYSTSKYNYYKQYTPYPFFPMYPYIVRYLKYIFFDVFLAGVILSNISLILASIVFYKLLKLDYSEKIAFYSVVFYIVFPFTFFLSGFFTESLFNLILFFSIYLARKKKYMYSTLMSMFLPVTRIFGVFLLPLLLIIFSKQIKRQEVFVKYLLLTCTLFPLIFLAHLNSLYRKTGDYFVFYNAQSAWSRSLGGTFLSNIAYNIKISPYISTFEISIFVLSIILFVVALIKLKTYSNKRMPLEYIFYSAFSFILPILTGVLQSMPRYSVTIFPIYLGLAYLSVASKKFILFALISFILSCVFMSIWSLGTLYIV